MNSAIEKILRVQVSPKFMAILDCMLGIEPRRTNPELVRLTAEASGGFLGQREGDVGLNDFLGSLSDLTHNLVGLAEVADLTQEETEWLLSQAPA